MRSLALALALVFASAATLAPESADARRIGGGGAVGMQRSLPATRAPEALPARPAAPVAQAPAAPTTAATPPVAPRRSWLGPIAGLAAGLGIAALMSHLGLGAAFGNVVMLLLLAIVAVVAIRFVMRRFAPAAASGAMQYAGAGAPAAQPSLATATATAFGAGAAAATTGSAFAPVAPSPAALPADFDAAAFERIAKLIFIRLQAANNVGDLDDLRAFTTPEMFAAIKLDLQDRSGAAQRTDVVRVDAEALDVASEANRQVVSVRFHGLIREEAEAAAAPFDEVWHLVRPSDGSREWAIAGIQQSTPALAASA